MDLDKGFSYFPVSPISWKYDGPIADKSLWDNMKGNLFINQSAPMDETPLSLSFLEPHLRMNLDMKVDFDSKLLHVWLSDLIQANDGINKEIDIFNYYLMDACDFHSNTIVSKYAQIGLFVFMSMSSCTKSLT